MNQTNLNRRNSSEINCTANSLTSSSSICYGCQTEIKDKHILRVAPDLEWHANCLKCVKCGNYLDEKCTCFVRDKKVYCKSDYQQLFGIKCSKCNEILAKTDLVMRVNNQVYHRNCARCFACSLHLLPGNEFAICDKNLYCKNHIKMISDCGNQKKCEPFNLPEDFGQSLSSPIATQRSSCSSLQIQMHSSTFHNIVNTTRPIKKEKKDKLKTTRIRTVLNEKQLQMLRACYGANPRPDALLKEQLVEMTGLSPRVIRVWFQNKRCKDKKRQIAAKQNEIQHQQEQKGDTCIFISGKTMESCNQICPTFNQMSPQFLQSQSHWQSQLVNTYPTHSTSYCDDDVNYHHQRQDLSNYPYQNSCLNYARSVSYEDDMSSHFHGSDLSSPSCSD